MSPSLVDQRRSVRACMTATTPLTSTRLTEASANSSPAGEVSLSGTGSSAFLAAAWRAAASSFGGRAGDLSRSVLERPRRQGAAAGQLQPADPPAVGAAGRHRLL